MATTKEHYDKHLSGIYSWMLGDVSAKMKEQEEFFKKHGFGSAAQAFALDLGAGNGLQSIPLARLGYSVIAIDFSKPLLAELKGYADELPIRLVHGDLTDIQGFKDLEPEVIVCCGDTLAHLPDASAIEQLFVDAYDVLAPKGRLYLSFRDYGTALQDIARFIPVKSDAENILTCMLEFAETTVRVTDIYHRKEGSSWKQHVSSYTKFRTTPVLIKNLLQKTGFNLQYDENIQRMQHVIAVK